MHRTLVRLGAATTAGALLLIPTAAQAHVSVSSPDAARKGFGKVVFRVPTESDTARTTKITITLPKDQPLAFVTTQAKPGWRAEVTETRLAKPLKTEYATVTKAPSSVTWTTTGQGVAPGEFDEFALSVGPLPDDATMTFAAQQTYSDGSVVDWDQAAKGDEEPEHPAPVLTLAAASDDGHHGASADAADDGHDDSDDGGSGTATAALVLSVVAVVLAAGGLLVAVRQNRRRA